MTIRKIRNVLITGGRGMLGRAMIDELRKNHPDISVWAPNRREIDWLDWSSIENSCEKLSKIDTIFHFAARVGGVKANSDFVADFFSENMQMNLNVFRATLEYNIQTVVSCLSTCVYPDRDFVSYPLTEDQLHVGPPHESNFGYAFAKRMLDVQSRSYRKQFGKNCITVIPNNLFGEHDNFHLEDSHVIPALIRKVLEAKLSNAPEVTIWGDGSPLREFTYAPDAARAILFVAENYSEEEPINIGATKEYSIAEVVDKIVDIFGYNGKLNYDTSMPSGQFRKPSSNAKLMKLNPSLWNENSYTSFDEGLRRTCEWVAAYYPNIRGVDVR